MEAYISPSNTMQASPQGGGFLDISSQFLQVLCLSVMCLQQYSLTFQFWEESKGNTNCLCCFRSLLDSLTNSLKESFP